MISVSLILFSGFCPTILFLRYKRGRWVVTSYHNKRMTSFTYKEYKGSTHKVTIRRLYLRTKNVILLNPTSCVLSCFCFLHRIFFCSKERTVVLLFKTIMLRFTACKYSPICHNKVLIPFRKMERAKGFAYYKCKSTIFLIKTNTFI